ncbi:MAG TPA: hypothetical protein VK728_15510 [Candidatus Sulfotelmatobacter sp.]|nr:hypothetical protein [Candidatus Sulfotelmatobacter sp.]
MAGPASGRFAQKLDIWIQPPPISDTNQWHSFLVNALIANCSTPDERRALANARRGGAGVLDSGGGVG